MVILIMPFLLHLAEEVKAKAEYCGMKNILCS
jgi:hypothetical protein